MYYSVFNPRVTGNVARLGPQVQPSAQWDLNQNRNQVLTDSKVTRQTTELVFQKVFSTHSLELRFRSSKWWMIFFWYGMHLVGFGFHVYFLVFKKDWNSKLIYVFASYSKTSPNELFYYRFCHLEIYRNVDQVSAH